MSKEAKTLCSDHKFLWHCFNFNELHKVWIKEGIDLSWALETAFMLLLWKAVQRRIQNVEKMMKNLSKKVKTIYSNRRLS